VGRDASWSDLHGRPSLIASFIHLGSIYLRGGRQ
jgi:hypothetical protein